LNNKEFDKGREVFNQFLSKSENLLFRSVLKRIRETNESEIGEVLFDQVCTCNLSGKSKGTVLSALLDSYSKSVRLAHVELVFHSLILLAGGSGRVDLALEKLKKSLDSKICVLEDINHTALVRMRDAVHAEGREFPYTIPPIQQR
jgi:hypothetical protein